MASNGSFNTNSYDGRYLKFEWKIDSQSIENNTTTISWSLTGAGNASAGWYRSGAFKVVIAGETVYSSSTRIQLYNGTVVATGKKTFTHNTDGNKSFSASAEAGIYTVAVNCKGSGSWSLTQIPRAAEITSAPNFTDEGNPVIKYNNPAGNAVDSLQACIGWTGNDDIAYRNVSKTGSSYTFSFTTAERQALQNACKNANSMTVRFYLKTVIGDSTFYSRVDKKLSIVNANPTISPTVKDKGSRSIVLTGDSNGKLIRGYNSMEVAANPTLKKGATIKSIKISSGGKSISTASGTLNNVTEDSFSFVLVDSRGNQAKGTVDKTMINYVPLTCNLTVTQPVATDTNIKFTVKGNYFNGTFGAVKNTLTVQYRYKIDNSSYSNWVDLSPTISGNTYTVTYNLAFNYQSTYTIQARALDQINNNTAEPAMLSVERVVSAKPVFDWSETDFNFNVPVTMNYNGYSYDLLGLFRAMTTTYTPECTVTPGENYSSATVTAHLTGCNLRIGLSATRNASLAEGNFTNETVCTIDIDHGGKLANLYRVSFNTSTSGGVATLDCQASKVNDDVVRLTINLCAAAQSITEFNAYFAMPCTIVTKAYV